VNSKVKFAALAYELAATWRQTTFIQMTRVNSRNDFAIDAKTIIVMLLLLVFIVIIIIIIITLTITTIIIYLFILFHYKIVLNVQIKK